MLRLRTLVAMNEQLQENLTGGNVKIRCKLFGKTKTKLITRSLMIRLGTWTPMCELLEVNLTGNILKPGSNYLERLKN